MQDRHLIERSKKVSQQLVGQLLVFHRVRNRAINIGRDNHFINGLRETADKLSQEQALNTLAKGAYLKGQINGIRQEIKRLISEADTLEKRREIYPLVVKLEEQANEAIEQLETLNYGG